jgi:hypothetical protein
MGGLHQYSAGHRDDHRTQRAGVWGGDHAQENSGRTGEHRTWNLGRAGRDCSQRRGRKGDDEQRAFTEAMTVTSDPEGQTADRREREGAPADDEPLRSTLSKQ